MIFSSIYESYVPAQDCPDADIKASIVFVADSDKLLIKQKEGEVIFPGLKDFDPDLPDSEETEYLGTFDGFHCFCVPYRETMNVPESLVFKSLRIMMREGLDENIALIASRAIHIAEWIKKNKYCGVCGGITEKNSSERARKCPSCGNIIYPRISPAIIIAVVKGDKLLLAHNKGFKERWYSTLAGFMEPGESIEACAQREVLEEVGIRIKNIRYFASQPWPFPDSLMIGLTAEYESGKVKPDGVELDDANFFGVDEFPETPGRSSVAGRLIEWFTENYRKK
jgi:NAD+ diphosphatase